ncbi:MAG: SUMF1/EgtB/PvdO family nonheme iron enzyme [Spirochaetota bacterium]
MNNKIKLINIIFIIIFVFLSASLIFGQNNSNKRRLIIILDASYSMQEMLNGDFKIALAKNTILSILETYSGADVGVIVYGHRYSTESSNSCSDIELIKPFNNEPVNIDYIMSLKGKGKTPISNALEFASKYFHPEKENHIVLLSDGIDTCNSDPCKTIIKLTNEFPNFKVDTVALTMNEKDKETLDCVSENSGGYFYSADNLPELRDGIVGFFYEMDSDTGMPKIEEKAKEMEDEIKDDMLYIKGGNYDMGKDDSIKKDEGPEHNVFVQSFYIKNTEVTNSEYAEFLNNVEKVESNWIDINKALISFDNGKYQAYKGAENLPVIFVSWFGADAYAKYKGGRLPYEAEWEFAAYGGKTGIKYPWGNDEFVNGEKMANYDYSRTDISNNDYMLMEVGKFEPNAYGLYDMAGNVWEWCDDWYDKEYYENSEKFVPSGPIKGKYKVRRGGSWFNNEISIRITNRGYARPSMKSRDTGFRYIIPITPDSLKEAGRDSNNTVSDEEQ